MNAEVTVSEMMNAREARAGAQRALLLRHPGATLVCLTMNVAGPVKTTARIERAFAWGEGQVRAVLAPLPLLFAHAIHEKTGPEAIFCVRADAKELKRRLCALEDGAPAGRLLDIDVIGPDGEKRSRTELGLPARRCLLCGEAAPVCARSRAHSVSQLRARTEAIIDEHFETEFAGRVAKEAERALLCEVAVTPKPGLVDRANAGAHEDMDIFTFIDSACALREYFEICARTGLAHRNGEARACFDALRVPGLLAEEAMRRATGGVNTHKGAIFSLGILCAALGMGYDGEGSDPERALERCGEMTRERMAQELRRAGEGEARTFGERLYAKSGAGGVRAEAAAGFPSVLGCALPRYRACRAAGMSENDAGLCVLVALMARAQDTNAVRRGGEEGARAMRKRARELDDGIEAWLGDGARQPQKKGEALRLSLKAWDEELSGARVSPGGCADLLAMTLLAGRI